MRKDNTIEAFFALVRAGLWEQEVSLSSYCDIDFLDIYRLAEEQSVLGLVAAGLEHVTDVKVPQADVFQFVGYALQLEQQNKAMNSFIAKLIDKMRKAGIYTLLVKGQGLAKNYERPLWRACGDVDLFMSDENYRKAKGLLLPLASSSKPEGLRELQLPMTIEGFVVELHGHLYGGLSHKIDNELQAVQVDTFNNGSVRSCEITKTQVFLLSIENDVFYVFAHILQHFYKGGIGLRQICDWCRLMWTYRGSLNYGLLEQRIKSAGLMSEWKAFYNLACRYLGMPDLDSRFMFHDSRFDKKADRICEFILEVGNFGHNRDMSFYHNGSYFVQKIKSFGRRCGDMISHFRIFPVGTIRFIPCIVFNGLRSAVRGE